MAIRALLFYSRLLFELVLSVVVHFVYAMIIFSSAVAADALQFRQSGLKSSKIVPIESDEEEDFEKPSMFLANSETGHHHGTFLEGFEKAPIVLVHGIFGFGKGKLGSISYWAGAEKKDDRVLLPDLGSLTSIHDRARELFYYLKGGTVDYGEEHSSRCGHSRLGKNHGQGHYSKWDEHHPIHFVGHSTGAQVVRVLQQMLANQEFEGFSTSADWILSLTSLSGALNGTTRVYIDGMEPDGRTMKRFSLLQLLRVAVLIYEWLDIPVLRTYYSFGFEHYNLQWHKIGIKKFIKTLLGRSGPFASGDWILPDLSIQSTVDVNSKLETHQNTFYFSYATRRTKKILGRTMPSTLLGIHPLLFVRTLQMCFWNHPPLDVPYKGYRDEDWYDNDGALNTISMLYPQFPVSHRNCLLEADFRDGQALRPGIWYYTVLEVDHIYFIINRERAGIHFDVLYDTIFERCRKHLRRPSKSL